MFNITALVQRIIHCRCPPYLTKLVCVHICNQFGKRAFSDAVQKLEAHSNCTICQFDPCTFCPWTYSMFPAYSVNT